MLPMARSEELTVRELQDETLIFDHRRSKAHCLNRITAVIWKHCDGRTDLAGLAALVEPLCGTDRGQTLVELALEQLASRHLLQTDVSRPSLEQRRSRRDLLKKLATAAVALPIIMTIAAPRANAAASKDVDTDNDPPLACQTNADCSSLTIQGGCVAGQCIANKCTMVTQANGTSCTLVGNSPGLCFNGICQQGG